MQRAIRRSFSIAYPTAAADLGVGRAVVSTDGQKGMCDTILLTDKTAAFTGRIG